MLDDEGMPVDKYKYKGVSLETTISLVYSDFNIPLPLSLNQDLVDILVDYKFKVNYIYFNVKLVASLLTF
jgi:hypothetical protein